MNLRAVAEPDCPERRIVDVIWFPTGGGKTEAYLGLSAFCMFLRRLRNPDHAGTSILMRYTLRLLTTQQFQRAASLICACEYIRRGNEDRLGSERFSIGLWVGTEVTPNSEKDAVTSLNNLLNHRGVNKFVILSCPWCGAAMGPQKMGSSAKCKGYRKLARPGRVRLICEDSDCDFSSDDGLPLAVIDEHIYESPPTLLIGTVDKFAMLAFRPEARRLFGIDTPFPPPELIIQDELHLISGAARVDGRALRNSHRRLVYYRDSKRTGTCQDHRIDRHDLHRGSGKPGQGPVRKRSLHVSTAGAQGR